MSKRRLEHMPLAEVLRAPRNPKSHDADGINGSISEFGLADLPVLDERTGRLVSGHGRLDDLQARYAAGEDPPDGVEKTKDGTWLVPVICGWSSKSDTHAEAYLLSANQWTIRGGWDQTNLAAVLTDLAAHDEHLAALAGWTADDIADLNRLMAPPDLDALAGQLGEPDPADTWPIVSLKVPRHLAAGWRSHVDTHMGDEVAAFAALLELDPEPPPPSDWTP